MNENKTYPIERVLMDADHMAEVATELLAGCASLAIASKAVNDKETAENLEALVRALCAIGEQASAMRLAMHEYRKRVQRFRDSLAESATAEQAEPTAPAVKESLTADRQAQPVARDVLMAFGKEVKKACGKAWGNADDGKEYAAIRDCDISAIVDRHATQPPAVAVAAHGENRKIGTLPVKDRYFLCHCEKCGWLGSSEECRESINHMYGDGDYYCPSCGATGPDEMYSPEEIFNVMLRELSPAVAVPVCYALVPIKTTDSMLDAAVSAGDEPGSDYYTIYAAMLAAAPQGEAK